MSEDRLDLPPWEDAGYTPREETGVRGTAPPTACPTPERSGTPDRFSLIKLFKLVSWMLQVASPEEFCHLWRQLDDCLFDIGGRMFGERNLKDEIQAISETEDLFEEETEGHLERGPGV